MHYQFTDGPVAVAPYVGVIIPTQEYVTFGHSAPGRGLEEYWVGFYAGTSLNEWIPRTYVQVRGNYAFVERVMDIAHDRSNATLEIGHFLTDRLSLRVLVSKQWTHGGINVPVPLDSPLFPVHDRLAAEEFVNLGAGVNWTINVGSVSTASTWRPTRDQRPQAGSPHVHRHELRCRRPLIALCTGLGDGFHPAAERHQQHLDLEFRVFLPDLVLELPQLDRMRLFLGFRILQVLLTRTSL